MNFRLTTLLCLLLISGIHAQRLHFVNYSVSEGLPQSQIYAMAEDSRGYLWFGTFGGGISRFDGLDFTNYNEDKGLSCPFVRCIALDRAGNLWIGTDAGLFVYNGKDFTLFDKAGMPPNTAVTALVAVNDSLWIGTRNSGLYRFAANSMVRYTSETGLSDTAVRALFKDRSGKIWISTEKGVDTLSAGKIAPFGGRKRFDRFPVQSFAQDSAGAVWFASYGGGAFRLINGTLLRYTVKDGLGSNTLSAVLCDNRGGVWLGSDRGASLYDGKEFRTFTTASGLCGDVIVSLMQDSFGTVWFGSSGGGTSRFDSERFIHFTENERFGKWVYAINQDKNLDYLFATSLGGFTRYDGTVFTRDKTDSMFAHVKIRAIARDSSGALWFGSQGKGLFRCMDGSYERFTGERGNCANFISGLACDGYGRLWFASLDRGVGYFDKDRKKAVRFSRKQGLPSDRVNAVCADSLGRVWAGTDGAGIVCFSPVNGGNGPPAVRKTAKEDGLADNAVRTLCCRGATVYVGTAAGINVIGAQGTISIIGRQNGLRSNNIYSLVFDLAGNLWAGSETGIDKIELRNGLKITHYGRDEGFAGVETCQNAAFRDATGRLWFGTVDGAVRYDAGEDRSDSLPPLIHITGLSLFFNRIENTVYGGTLPAWSTLPEKLLLPYDKNHLSFTFIGIDYRNPQGVRYKWKLDGFDRDWSPLIDRREATYSNLPPGRYVFRVTACNGSGVWAANPAAFRFEIRPPFWALARVRIAIAGAALLLIGAAIGAQVRRSRRKDLEERQRLRMEKHILELQQATSRLQMNPHFIFNSLNSIQGYLSDNDPEQAKWYLSKFAKLMRLILENAREEFIPLADEISILENYLVLEKLRRNDKFDYSLIVPGEVDVHAIEVPPMLYQPFVENAVLHGIKYLEGRGTLTVEFRVIAGILVCEIVDNGVGRERAGELRGKSLAQNKTSAIKITEERLKGLYNDAAGIDFTDLKDAQGKALGTKVTITIPVGP